MRFAKTERGWVGMLGHTNCCGLRIIFSPKTHVFSVPSISTCSLEFMKCKLFLKFLRGMKVQRRENVFLCGRARIKKTEKKKNPTSGREALR